MKPDPDAVVVDSPAPPLRTGDHPSTLFPAGLFHAEREPKEHLKVSVARLHEELAACQRLALLGNLAGAFVHEFNNLMTPVLVRVQDALARGDPQATRSALERTLAQVTRALEVTRQLLSLAGPPLIGGAQPCRVADLVAEVLETLPRDGDWRRVTISVDVAPGLSIVAQPLLASQVLLNLVVNAAAALPERRGTIRIAARRKADQVLIRVADDGRGIPLQRLREVINPFLASDWRAHPCDWHHVGLGLNTCRVIAQQHGARLWGERNGSGGCTFCLLWPSSTARARKPQGRTDGPRLTVTCRRPAADGPVRVRRLRTR